MPSYGLRRRRRRSARRRRRGAPGRSPRSRARCRRPRTRAAASPVRRARVSTSRTEPSSVNLIALFVRLMRIWLQRAAVARDRRDVRGRDLEREALLRRPAGRSVAATSSSSSAQSIGSRWSSSLPALDPRQVEQVVDQREQVPAAGLHDPQLLGLLLVELARQLHEEGSGEPEDRVQRRPQLVAHAGQEAILGAARRLEPGVRVDERPARRACARSRRGSTPWRAARPRSSGLRLISTGNSLPSRRRPRSSSPAPIARVRGAAARCCGVLRAESAPGSASRPDGRSARSRS